MTARALWTAAALLALALSGCNLVFGLDEPTLADASGAGGQGAAGPGSGGAGGSGAGTGADGGGGAAPGCDTCPGACFEGVCDGHKPAQLAPGGQVGCVRLRSGSVFCFGANRFAGLGIAPAASPDSCQTSINGIDVGCSHAAIRVDLPGRAISIASGHHAACAVLENGDLYCWGRNDRGLLGHLPSPDDDQCDGIPCSHTPKEVEGVPPVHLVAMSETHACAAANDGTFWCWGLNDWGQLGDGNSKPVNLGQAIDPSSITEPAAIPTAPTNIARIALSSGHSCVVATGQAGLETWCWGENVFGAAGPTAKDTCSAGACSTEPVLVPELQTDNKVALAVARSATCVRDALGQLQCAGWNGWSFLGASWDTSAHAATPFPVLPGDSPIWVSGGDTHLCYLALDGGVVCWGGTFFGGLGTPGSEGSGDACAYQLPCDPAPHEVAVSAKLLTVGNNVSFAVDTDDRVVAWGISQGGQLGRAPDPTNDAICAYYDTTADDIYCSASPTFVEGLPGPDS